MKTANHLIILARPLVALAVGRKDSIRTGDVSAGKCAQWQGESRES